MNDISRTLPWYRHLWPWLLMIAPAGAVIGGAITIWLAVRTNDGLVADDYYKQGLAVNQVTARDQQAHALGLQAELMLGDNRRDVRLILRSGHGGLLPDILVLHMIHPTRAGIDQTVRLHRQAVGIYSGQLARGLSGFWRVSVEDEQKAWRLTGVWMLEKMPVLRLP